MARMLVLVALLIALPAGAGPLAAAASPAPAAAVAAVPTDGEIRRIIDDRVRALGEGVGIVVGVVGPQRRAVVAAGRRDASDERPLDGRTRFEIGSITKVFTALLLADSVERHAVALDTPIADFLPPDLAGTAVARAVTLADLATHTAGMPFMPPEVASAGDLRALPYGRDRLVALVRGAKPSRGARWDYSNVGYWLLGEALAARAGTPFPLLLERRVLAPLGLGATSFAAADGELAPGHDARLRPAAAVAAVPVLAVMPAAGGLVSSADDLLDFLAQAMGIRPSRLSRPLDAMLRVRRATGEPGIAQALGWEVIGAGADELVVHDGGTLGYASSLAWDPGTRTGVVVLSNDVTSVADIARHLMRPSMPLQTPPPRPRPEIALPAAALDACVGTFEAKGEGRFVVARDGDHLVLTLPAGWGLPQLRLRPESATEFFVAELPLRAVFHLGTGARAAAVTIFPPRGQRGVEAERVEPR